MFKLLPILLISLIGLSSCRKDEPVIIEVEIEEEVIEENVLNAQVNFSSDSYSGYEVKVNDVQMQETTFPVLIGDTINVFVSHNCWNYIYYGLGDTVGTQLVGCDVIGISLYLNNTIVAGSSCNAPFPYTCQNSYLQYIIE